MHICSTKLSMAETLAKPREFVVALASLWWVAVCLQARPPGERLLLQHRSPDQGFQEQPGWEGLLRARRCPLAGVLMLAKSGGEWMIVSCWSRC